MLSEQQRELKALGWSAFLIVGVAAAYAGGSAYLDARERSAVKTLLSKSVSNEALQFGRFAAFGHEYCQEVLIAGARKTMRVGPRSWDSGPLVIRGANLTFEECQTEARG